MPRQRYSIGALTTDYKTVVVSIDNRAIVVSWMWITNIAGSAATVEIAHVPSGSDAGTSMDLVNDLSVDPNTYSVTEMGIFLSPGDKIVAKSNTASSIILTFYGTEEYVSQITDRSTLAENKEIGAQLGLGSSGGPSVGGFGGGGGSGTGGGGGWGSGP